MLTFKLRSLRVSMLCHLPSENPSQKELFTGISIAYALRYNYNLTDHLSFGDLLRIRRNCLHYSNLRHKYSRTETSSIPIVPSSLLVACLWNDYDCTFPALSLPHSP